MFESIQPILLPGAYLTIPLELIVASYVPYIIEAYKRCDILLWKIKAKITNLKVREIELAHVII